MGQRRRAREYALQLLFQIDVTRSSPDQVFEAFWVNQDTADEVRSFSEHLVQGVCAQREELDRLIVEAARNWRLERMAVVDRNVLRMAAYEMLADPDVPAAVVIDEAIEVAKKYGSEESGGFINGILDNIRRRVRPDGAPPAGPQRVGE